MCKSCNINNDKIKHNIAIDNIVNALRIHCIHNTKAELKDNDGEGSIQHRTQGIDCCDWIGFLSDYNAHINAECLYVSVLCEYCKKHKCIKKLLNKHYDSCDNVFVFCELKCGIKIERYKMKNHIQTECHNYLLPCNHKGCKDKIRRIDHKNHLNSCEYKPVICPYKVYGCDINDLNKKMLNDHLKTYKIEHYLFKIDCDNNDIKKKLNDIESRLGKLEIKQKNINYKPNKPSIDCRFIDCNTINLSISSYKNMGNYVDKYILKYTRYNTGIFGENMTKLDISLKLDELLLNDDEKLEWITENIKYDKSVSSQQHKIYVNGIKYRIIIVIYAHNNCEISPINFIITPSLNFNSNIVFGSYKETLINMLLAEQKNSVYLKRIYSGKNDGFYADSYHGRCNNKGPRIILIKNEFNTIFGGYISTFFKPSITGWNTYKKDGDSYLFRLTPQLSIFKQRNINGDNAIYYDRKNLCVFGKGYDLFISNKCNNNRFSYGFSKSYSFDRGSDLVGGNDVLNTAYFKVTDIEVFEIHFCKWC